MPNKLRIPSPWSQLSLFVTLGLTMFVLSSVLGYVIYRKAGIENPLNVGTDEAAYADVGKLVQFIFSVTVFGLTGYLYAKLTFFGRPGYYLGLRPAMHY